MTSITDRDVKRGSNRYTAFILIFDSNLFNIISSKHKYFIPPKDHEIDEYHIILFLLNSLLFHSNNRIGYDQVNDSEKHPLDHIVAIQHYIHS